MRILKILLASLLFLTTAAIVLWSTVGARLTRSLLLSHLRADCPKCRFEIGSLDISLLSNRAEMTGAEFAEGGEKDTVVAVIVHKASLSFDSSRIAALVVDGLEVTVREHDGDIPGPSRDFPAPGYVVSSLPALRANGIVVHDGKLTYEFEKGGKIAAIHVRKIEAEVGDFVTRYELITKPFEHPIHMRADARLEESGTAKVTVSFDPFAERNRDEVDVDLRGQNLSELNPFFTIDDGVELSGVLHHGHAAMTMAEGMLTGELTATYENLNVKFHSTPERSGLAAFFMSTITALERVKTRTGDGKGNEMPRAPIQCRRDPHTTVVKWLLKGLKSAADTLITHRSDQTEHR